MRNTDALGYDARRSDPLYKSIPFVIAHNAETGLAYGLFYDTYADAAVDPRLRAQPLPRPLPQLRGRGRRPRPLHDRGPGHRRRHPPLHLADRPPGAPAALGAGPIPAPAWPTPTRRTPRRAWPSSSTPAAATTSSAEASVHLSSGYTSIGARRFVFHLEPREVSRPGRISPPPCTRPEKPRHRQRQTVPPDRPPAARRERGLKGCSSRRPDGEPAWAQFWDELGAYLDFTKPATAAWWRGARRRPRALLDVGIDATWNDNNEFEITSPPVSAGGRRLGHRRQAAADHADAQGVAWTRSAACAGRAALPGQPLGRRRPAALRADLDRRTTPPAWETLRWNIRMGLGLSLLGRLQPRPRHRRFRRPAAGRRTLRPLGRGGVFMPRFSIHSWNADGTVNAPWMHPDATPLVRDLIRLREQLIPYLYDLAWRHHRDGEPIQRPTFFDLPDDPAAFQDCDELMLKPALLVCSVVEPGATERRVRPPAGARAGATSGPARPTRAAARSSCPPRPAGRRSWCAKTRRSRSTSPRKSFDARATCAPSPSSPAPNSLSKRSAVRTTA